MALSISITSFLTIALLIWSFYGGREARRRAFAQRVTAISAGHLPETSPASARPLLRRTKKAQGNNVETPKTVQELEQAGLLWGPTGYLTIRLTSAVIVFIFTIIISGNFLVAPITGAAGYFLPRWYVSSRRNRRLTRLDDQLSELLVLLSNALKSGHGLLQGIEFASNQITPPLSLELKRLLRDINLGIPFDDALAAMNTRIGTMDMDMVVTAISIHRSVGGNLSEILDTVTATIRERERLRGQIRVLTSQQRLTGLVIGLLPFGLGLIFFAANPDYMGVLFNSTAGRIMLTLAFGLETMGFILIRKIVAVEA